MVPIFYYWLKSCLCISSKSKGITPRYKYIYLCNQNVLRVREQKCFTKTAIKDVTEPIFPPCDLKNVQITNVHAFVQLLPISLYTLPGEKSLQISKKVSSTK